ncbi:zingipain-1-like [Dioscorea cayenensis subsp. rotundata]|uniref:Zingipain-1-like n=1 Tax=Dioscorea cayennensis subsp. rotundata TaxID=55577 RepID=A0AB40BX04_DIOCR|nr:zingipain-1-like [Dioscorea cayenensis subsp. rotundata]
MSSLLLFISILLLFTTICFSSRIPIRSDYEVSLLYEGWLVRHNKFYSDSSEKERRYEIFKDNLKYIDKHNAGNHTYTLALNVFADLTVEEYRATFLRTLPPRKWKMENDSEAFNDNVGVAPDSIDWRDEGVINPIRHQGGCFSCWAFAVLTTVEAVNKIVTGDLVTLSEQQLVDCFNKGCQPSYLDDAYQYIIDNGGVDTEADYPYTAKYSNSCDTTKESNKVVTIDGYRMVRRNNENALKVAVADQPVAAAVEGYGKNFQLYGNGIFTQFCGTKVDHAVALIGYDSEGGKDYWIVRNSWGDGWGENGYMKLERNIQSRSGKCGIASWPYYPIKYSNMKNKGNTLEVEAEEEKARRSGEK